ncbi:uncharacterized mitochondrial protein AtMg00810-like [Aristolochia californica]|uniref:uncharacterized mitochondrial protein AtMg00810-like n=1 Tax=Aristolochia californica TaxID=171875 RepID=UPI0035DB0903
MAQLSIPSASLAHTTPTAVHHSRSLFQIDIKNAFLYGDLKEKIYMEQLPGYVAQGETHKLANHFQTKDPGQLKYFLGIEVARSKEGTTLTQRKYITDILQEYGLLGAKLADTPMEVGLDLHNDQSLELKDNTMYRRLVDKLVYAIVTRPDISFAVSIVSQFMEHPNKIHLEVAQRILRYLKGALGKGLLSKPNNLLNIEAFSNADYADSKLDRKSITGYYVFLGGNLVSRKKMLLLGPV